MKQKTEIYCPKMPLAVYREVAAHLRQVGGVTVTLTPQTDTIFEYQQSQIGSLCLESDTDEQGARQIQAILEYYAQQHGSWQQKS